MATNCENAGQRKTDRQEQPNNIAVEFAEIKRLLREIDDFVSKLKTLEETLAQHAEEDEIDNMLVDRPAVLDHAGLDTLNDPTQAARKKPTLVV